MANETPENLTRCTSRSYISPHGSYVESSFAENITPKQRTKNDVHIIRAYCCCTIPQQNSSLGTSSRITSVLDFHSTTYQPEYLLGNKPVGDDQVSRLQLPQSRHGEQVGIARP